MHHSTLQQLAIGCRDKVGTVAGYWRHKAGQERACKYCADAYNEAMRKRRARARAALVIDATTAAHRALADALDALPKPTVCADNDLWTVNDRASLHIAAALCHGCPVLDPCRTAGAHETAGVWGGHIRGYTAETPQPANPHTTGAHP